MAGNFKAADLIGVLYFCPNSRAGTKNQEPNHKKIEICIYLVLVI
jgi:hypothetical protein